MPDDVGPEMLDTTSVASGCCRAATELGGRARKSRLCPKLPGSAGGLAPLAVTPKKFAAILLMPVQLLLLLPGKVRTGSGCESVKFYRKECGGQPPV